MTSAGACTNSSQLKFGNSNILSELNSIVAMFTPVQVKLAEATGFGAFSKKIHEIQFDRQFAIWLLPKVDSMSRSVGANPGKRLMIFQEDVAKVFGTPCGGKAVWDVSLDKSQAMRKKVEEMIGIDENNAAPSEAAKNTLLSMGGRELSPWEEEKFKASFVVYVVSLLVDSKLPCETESTNYWPAFTNTADIHKLNWSGYVLEEIFSSCSAARACIRKNTTPTPSAGTVLFLQVRTFFCVLAQLLGHTF